MRSFPSCNFIVYCHHLYQAVGSHLHTIETRTKCSSRRNTEHQKPCTVNVALCFIKLGNFLTEQANLKHVSIHARKSGANRELKGKFEVAVCFKYG